jgi:hypothetical protein
VDGQEIVTASVVQYRVIRPGGTVLDQHLVASYMDAAAAWREQLADRPGRLD